MPRLPVVAALLLACSMFAHADPKGLANEKPVVAQKLSEFEAQAATVREGMQAGGVYGYIGADDRHKVEQRLDDMHALLQRHAQDEALTPAEKVTLLNAQEEVNGVLLQNDNNRLECEHGARTGSRIHVTTCHTHGELMAREHRDQGALSDIQRQPQTQLPSKDH